MQLIHRQVWFNGVNSQVVGTDVDCPGSFTIGCRFKTDKKINATQSLIAKDDTALGTNINYMIRIESTGVLYGVFGNGVATMIEISGNTKVTDGMWHQGVVVFDATASQLRLYLDAVQDKTPTASGATLPSTNNVPFRLGCYAGSYFMFNGYMADAFIYNRALSEAEINYNYLHPNNPIRRGLQVSYTQDSIDRPAAGTWQDRSGNARNGTITNATTSKYPAIRSGANRLYFMAGTDKVDCGNGASLNPATTGLISGEIWVKISPMVILDTVLANKFDGAAGWFLQYNHVNSHIHFFSGAGDAIDSVSNLNIFDQWLHICFTFTGGAATGKIYINGVDKTSVQTARVLANSASNLIVGNYLGAGSFAPIGGYIAAARIYNRILSAAEVAYNYTHPNNPIKRGRVLDLSQESLYGSYWYDQSGNANNGTITGAVAKNLGLIDGR